MWESKTNVGAILLEAGLAKLQTGFGADRIADAHLLAQAEQSAKRQKLKARSLYILLCIYYYIFMKSALIDIVLLQIWENYVEGEEVTNGSTPEKKQKEEFKVLRVILVNDYYS